MTDRAKHLELFWADGTPRSVNNAFTSSGYTPTARERQSEAAAKGGYASVIAKRERGQELIPKLWLKGEKPQSRRRVRDPETVE